MIVAQAHVWDVAGPDRTRPVWLDVDAGVARWRRIVQSGLEAERGAATP